MYACNVRCDFPSGKFHQNWRSQLDEVKRQWRANEEPMKSLCIATSLKKKNIMLKPTCVCRGVFGCSTACWVVMKANATACLIDCCVFFIVLILFGEFLIEIIEHFLALILCCITSSILFEICAYFNEWMWVIPTVYFVYSYFLLYGKLSRFIKTLQHLN